MLAALVATSILGVGPAAEGEGPTQEPLGGYWGIAERRAPEPKDGRSELFIGAFLLPIGLLRAGGGIAMTYAARPAGCPALTRRYGIPTEDCGSVAAFGYYGASLGGLMAVTGAVLLGIGASRAKRHREWQEQPTRLGIRVRPTLGVGVSSVSMGVHLRF